MFTRPDDLTDADIAATVAAGWGVLADTVEHAAVGFGSHHWRVTAGPARWFVSVDDLEARRRDATETRADAGDRLAAALTAARSLRDAGLEFVVAPRRTMAGALVQPVDDRYVAALYPHVEGAAHPWGSYPTRQQRLAALDLIVAVHAVGAAVTGGAIRDDHAIPRRAELAAALTDDEAPWGPGPFADEARDLLHGRRDAVQRSLARYDGLVDEVAARDGRRVLTHGEPHRANTIATATGPVLIDWDTALVAPPERDLWMLADEDPAIVAVYTERTGVAVDDGALELYRLWWELCEISLFVADLRRPHRDTADTRTAWAQLASYLDGGGSRTER